MSDYGYGRRGGSDQRRSGSRGDDDNYDDRGRSTLQRLDSIQDPGKRYLLRECIGSGVCGDVYEAIDQQAGTISCPRRKDIHDTPSFYRKQKGCGEGAKAHA